MISKTMRTTRNERIDAHRRRLYRNLLRRVACHVVTLIHVESVAFGPITKHSQTGFFDASLSFLNYCGKRPRRSRGNPPLTRPQTCTTTNAERWPQHVATMIRLPLYKMTSETNSMPNRDGLRGRHCRDSWTFPLSHWGYRGSSGMTRLAFSEPTKFEHLGVPRVRCSASNRWK